VIGRKRSAQDSWDDACASTSFGRWSTCLKRRLSIDLIFNPKENTMLKNFLQDETGAELAEYAVAVALLVAIALIVYNLLGKAINDSNATTGSTIQNAKFNP
jgi:Flp pilus assembly pilin Flp